MTSMDALDVDPFAAPSTSTRFDYLFHLRRATHRFLIRHAATLWTTEQRHSGRISTAPPHI
ncbi:hypothetical protein, partial [Actinomadura darangshiensis]|uniref:hypothetical protein n=1 Tax=Actinomadura darangshiensis TaxID=705336 RepID=UPI001A9EA29B